MSNQFLKLRRSAVPGRIPTTSSLDLGEIALNTYDGLAFMKKSGSSGEEIVTLGTGTGSGGSSNITGSQFFIPVFNSTSSLINSSIYSSGSIVIIGATQSIHALAPERFAVYAGNTTSYNLISGHSNVNNYSQLNIKNFNSGSSASSDIVATADDGDETTGYIDMGINSSQYTATNFVGTAKDAYVYSTGNNLYIGNATPDKQVIIFNGGLDAINQSRIFIHDQGTISINTDQYNTTNPPSLAVNAPNTTTNTLIEGVGASDQFLQLAIANSNNGQFASSDIVAYNNLDPTNQGFGFIDMGINSTNFNDPTNYPGWTAGHSYVYSDAPGMIIGSTSGSSQINLFVGGNNPITNSKLVIRANNIHSLTGSLQVTGSITSSLFGTASWAQNATTSSYILNAVSASYAATASIATSASFASTASSADNFLVRGTLTAQTIVAQTITSSTDFVTGSTRFGTLLSNTHQFTGSVSITGSLNVVGAGITGSLFGTSSWATNALTASYVSASNVAGLSLSQITLGAVTASVNAGSNIFNIISGSNTLVVVDSTGSMGIGTTSPGYKLDVNGTARVSGDATIVGRTIFGINYFASTNTSFGWFSDGNTPLRILNGLSGGVSLFNLSSGGQISAGAGFDGNRIYAARNPESDTTTSYSALFTSQTSLSGRNLSNWTKVITNITTEGGGSVSNAPLITYLNITKGNVTGYTTYRGVDVQDLDSYFGSTSGSVSIGSTYSINASAILQLTSTTKGFLPTRTDLTSNISSPAQGLITYLTGSANEGLWYYSSGSIKAWTRLLNDTGSQSITGSLTATSFTGSLQGTSSWAQNAVTSSYILQAVSASFASTASYWSGSILNATSASFASTSSLPLRGLITASVAGATITFTKGDSTTFDLTIAQSGTVSTASYVTSSGVYGPNGSNSILSSSFALTASYWSGTVTSASYASSSTSASFASTASYWSGSILNAASASFASTASYILNVVSASFASTASSADNFTVRGTLTAQTIVAQTITSSTDFVTGSTRFGSLLSNTHQFTGSVSITGSLIVAGAGITGSLFGTSSWANNAITSSYILNAVSASFASTASYWSGSILNAASASFASTASYVLQAVSASFAATASYANSPFDIGIAEFNSTSSATAAGTTTVSSIATGSFTSAFYNYTIASGSNARAGQVMSVWSGTTVRYTEVTTTDIGNTATASFAVAISGANVNLSFTAPGIWTVKSIANLL